MPKDEEAKLMQHILGIKKADISRLFSVAGVGLEPTAFGL
jgi:hypothetical protein